MKRLSPNFSNQTQITRILSSSFFLIYLCSFTSQQSSFANRVKFGQSGEISRVCRIQFGYCQNDSNAIKQCNNTNTIKFLLVVYFLYTYQHLLFLYRSFLKLAAWLKRNRNLQGCVEGHTQGCESGILHVIVFKYIIFSWILQDIR